MLDSLINKIINNLKIKIKNLEIILNIDDLFIINININ